MANKLLPLALAVGGFYYYNKGRNGNAKATTPSSPVITSPPIVTPPPVIVPPPTVPPATTGVAKLIPDDLYVFGKRSRNGVTPAIGEFVGIGGPFIGSYHVSVALDNGATPDATMVTLVSLNGNFDWHPNRPDGSPSSDGIITSLHSITREKWDLSSGISLGSMPASENIDASGVYFRESNSDNPNRDILRSVQIYGMTAFNPESDSFCRWYINTGKSAPGSDLDFNYQQRLPFASIQSPARRQYLIIKVPLGRTLVWK